jgi:Leucine-rich repeat (LRR) protein
MRTYTNRQTYVLDNKGFAQLLEYHSGNTDITCLDISSSNVSSITGIECLPCLEILSIANTRVYDAKPFTKLPNLRVVDISGTFITDLTPFEHCSKLEIIDLNNTAPNSLKPLARCKKLEWIGLQDVNIELMPLAELPVLEVLNSNYADISKLVWRTMFGQLTIVNLPR